MKDQIYIWSIPIKTTRNILPGNSINWASKYLKLAVHTFVTNKKIIRHLPLNPINNFYYWFCAGDFCPTDEEGIKGYVVDNVLLPYAYCLVKPNIQKSEPDHKLEVIGGEYGIDYVCHNITNRILYASEIPFSLARTSIPLIGYKTIINSPLGLYGRIQREWLLTIEKCSSAPVIGVGTVYNCPPPTEVLDEIDLIHTRAANGDKLKGKRITDATKDIDYDFYNKSHLIFKKYDDNLINKEKLNLMMLELIEKTITETEKIIGEDLTQSIYGLYEFSFATKKEKGDNQKALYGKL